MAILSLPTLVSGLLVGKADNNKGREKLFVMDHIPSNLLSTNANALRIATTVSSQKISIPNMEGEKLAGILESTGSKKLCILCHGYRSNKETSTLRTLASALLEEGISTFRFDFSGNGDSEGSFAYGNYWKEADDIRSVILYWRTERYQVDFLMGHSKGGNAVLLYASKYGDVPIVVNVSGRFALEGGIAERLGKNFRQEIEEHGFLVVRDESGGVAYKVTKKSLLDRLNTDMKTACLSIPKSCRVLTVHGSRDEIVPVSEAFEFDKIIPCHQLKVVEGADHSFKFHKNELKEAVLQFIQQIGLMDQ